jgi:hypothetical protein
VLPAQVIIIRELAIKSRSTVSAVAGDLVAPGNPRQEAISSSAPSENPVTGDPIRKHAGLLNQIDDSANSANMRETLTQ